MGRQLCLADPACTRHHLTDDRRAARGHCRIEIIDNSAVLKVAGLAWDNPDPLRPGDRSTRGRIIGNPVSASDSKAAITGVDRNSATEAIVVRGRISDIGALGRRPV
jgi:hypothetical protein